MIDPQIGTNKNRVGVSAVLGNRIDDQTRWHTPHRWTPALAFVRTDEEKSATSRCVYRSRINPVRILTIRDYGVGESSTVTAIRRQETFSTVIRDHHAIV